LSRLPSFFTTTSTTDISTLSLHDALPIWAGAVFHPLQSRIVEPSRRVGADCLEDVLHGDVAAVDVARRDRSAVEHEPRHVEPRQDRKSTRLNSSHSQISYAVFCLKKKKRT